MPREPYPAFTVVGKRKLIKKRKPLNAMRLSQYG